MKHGIGKLQFGDGSIYEGELYKNLMQGQGTFKCADGTRSYSGQWVNSKMQGSGTMVWSNG